MRFKAVIFTSAALLAMAPAATPVNAQTTTGATAAKPIKPLYRSLRPWYRSLRPWYRSLRPWYRSLRPWEVATAGTTPTSDLARNGSPAFWGTTNPSARATAAGAPSFATQAPFWDGLDTRWADIGDAWESAGAYDANVATYQNVATGISGLVQLSRDYWGAAVTARTGQSFEAGFAAPLLARYGLDLNDPQSFARLDAIDRQRFYVEWYDGLNAFGGNDHVDYWMPMVNWTPRLTQTQGGGTQATIGLIDFYVPADADIKARLIYSGGVSSFTSGHGAGVLSLIGGAHDGRGVMGIAPQALITAYNPFDANGTAGWTDVINGIVEVTKERGTAKNRASVVNLSLGVSGWTLPPEWQTVFKTSAVDSQKDLTIYVIAAGNDGLAQTKNVEMNGALESTFIVVGSVDPSGVISSFSNRPGTACLTDGGSCKNEEGLNKSSALMNRFIVAPGELLLVSDGKGGVTRESGTSFSAPLVSGAIALLHDRWPWLKNYPRDVAQVILNSARDLGAPGIDPVYGVGLLDVEAAQSPLNFGELQYYLYTGTSGTETVVQADAITTQSLQQSWSTGATYFSAFEKLDSQERDFLIPLSSRLVGTTRNGEFFQDFVFNRLNAWVAGGGGFRSGSMGFTDQSSDVRDNGGWKVTTTGRLTGGYTAANGYRELRLRSSVSVEAPDSAFGVTAGVGDGALMINRGAGFALSSDFDPSSGGVNPLLGFASGGAHIGVRTRVAPAIDVSINFTEQRRSVEDDIHGELRGVDRQIATRAGGYSAGAVNLRVDYRATDWLDLNASYTRLGERNALLGVRSQEATDLMGGTTTDGATVGARIALPKGFSLLGSASAMRSRSAGDSAGLRLANGGALATAYQIAVAKTGVLAKRDNLRISVARPLTIQRGLLEFTSVAVVDRETGEKGLVTETIDIGDIQQRRYVLEGSYAFPLRNGRGSVSLFGRGELGRVDRGSPAAVAGAQLNIAL